jgi:hypothetical protein
MRNSVKAAIGMLVVSAGVAHAGSVATLAQSVRLQPGDAALVSRAANAGQAYVTQEGHMELHPQRQMIVRPFTLEAWTAAGWTLEQAAQNRARAVDRIAPLINVEASRGIAPNQEYVINLPEGLTENQMAAFLMATRDYQYAEPDWIVFPQIIPNDPQFANGTGGMYWHTRIRTTQAWDRVTGLQSVQLSNVDTGVRRTHQDWGNNLSQTLGYNSASLQTIAQGGPTVIDDINGHGTQTGSCILAQGNNGLNIVGVMWDGTLVHVRCTNSTGGSASISSLTGGALWAAQNGSRGVSVSYSGITNTSIGTTGTTMMNTYNSVLLWAAGNNGANLGAATDYPDVVIVGATDSNDNRASFSAVGRAIDVVAPGVSVLMLSRTSDTATSTNSGTSFSTPIANGVLGLIYSANPNLTARQAMNILQDTARDLGAPGPDDIFGNGIVNAEAAVNAALATNCRGDWNGDGVVDFNDLLAYLNDYNAQNPRADVNADGVVDFNDLLAFLNLYNTPCA